MKTMSSGRGSFRALTLHRADSHKCVRFPLGPVTRKGDAVPVPFDVVSQAQRFEPFISLAD